MRLDDEDAQKLGLELEPADIQGKGHVPFYPYKPVSPAALDAAYEDMYKTHPPQPAAPAAAPAAAAGSNSAAGNNTCSN